MKLQTLRRNGGIAAAVLALSLGLAACGDDSEGNDASDDTSSSAPADDAPADDMGDEADPAAQTFGPGCSQIPTSGDGSFTGMVQDPVGTAASTNPLLKTLTAAVGAVEGLGDTLNSAEGLTVFAPADPAFAEIPKADLTALLEGAAKDGMTSDLATVLTYHVVEGQLDPASVVGEQTTLQGDTVTVEGDESGMTVNGATVLCGNIPTANATVYVIDTVLNPAA
jgi:uncharacterized surface protein with fasciclin (FAS1) repeats